MVSIFSDASFDPRSRIGVSGILVVSAANLKVFDGSLEVQLALHRETACTELEINSVIAAMTHVKKMQLSTVTIFSDCKTAIDLSRRREKLEVNNYLTKASGEKHKHAELYKEFFRLYDQTTPVLTWLKGHKTSSQRSIIECYFSFVDRTCREALRRHVAEF